MSVSAGTASADDFAAVEDFTLTIPAGKASVTERFMLTPVDDAIDEPEETVRVSGTAQGLEVTAATVTVSDDDGRGVTVSATALRVPEGDSRTYTVVLSSQPVGPVTVTPSVAGSPDVTVSGALTFTAATWNRAQTVTVSAAQDADAADDAATVSHAVSGSDYGSVTVPDVAVTVEDDETASGGVALTVSPGTVDEDAGATTVTVTGTLDGAPRLAETAVSVSAGTASAADFAAVQDFTLTIAAGQSSGTATFTLTPVDDAIDEGDETVNVTGTAQGLTVTGAAVEIVDDDGRGIEVSASSLTVPEGASRTYTVVLTSEPSGPVTVTPSVAGSSDVTVSGALTFTAATWNRAQTVTVSAAQDADAADDAATVSHAVSGGGYGSVTVPDVAVTVSDDDTASTAVALTVSPGTVNEDAGAAAIAVTGTLNEATRTSDTAVTVSVSPGTASTGDFLPVQDFALTIPAGRASGTATFTLTPVDDAIDESEETVRVSGTAQGLEVTAATVKITNSDSVPTAWIARFGRTVAEQVLEAVQRRTTGPRAPGVEVRLAGQRIGNAATVADGVDPQKFTWHAAGQSLTGWQGQASDPTQQSGFGSRPVTERDLLTGSSFSIAEGTEESGLVSIWGRGAMTRFSGRENAVSLDGEVISGQLGADWTRGDATVGLVLSHSRGDGGYRGASDSGSVSATQTGIYPWGRYVLSDRISVWGVAGYGAGALTLKPADMQRIQTDLDLMMVSGGLRGVLLQAPETGGLELAAKTDGLYVRTKTGAAAGLAAAAAEVTRHRLALEGSRPFHFDGEAALTPSFEIGVRHDGGDAETGFGLDIGVGLGWVNPASGISADLSGRGLLTHESRGFRDYGIAGSLAWDPAPASDRGPSLTLSQTMGGAATGGMDALLTRGTLDDLAANGNGHGLQNRRLELKLGYGFSAFGDRFTSTPEFGLGLSNGHREYSLGWRLNLVSSGPNALELGLEAARREHANEDGDDEHAIGFRLRARF